MARELYKNELGNGSPTKILLGLQEQEKFKNLCMSSIHFSRNAGKTLYRETLLSGIGDKRVEYCGLKVYSVDDETYCVAVK